MACALAALGASTVVAQTSPEELSSPKPVLPRDAPAPQNPVDPETTLPETELPRTPSPAEVQRLQEQLRGQQQELEDLRAQLRDERAQAQLEATEQTNEHLAGIEQDVQLGLQAQALRAQQEETARAAVDQGLGLLRASELALAYGTSGLDATLAQAEQIFIGEPRSLVIEARRSLQAGDLFNARLKISAAGNAAMQARLSGRAIEIVAL